MAKMHQQGKVLTRQDMEAILARGESVIHDGSVITELHELPTEAQLAGGDEDKLRLAHDHLDEQIAALQEQKKQTAASFKRRAELSKEEEQQMKEKEKTDKRLAKEHQDRLKEATGKKRGRPSRAEKEAAAAEAAESGHEEPSSVTGGHAQEQGDG
jgi:hypothetical protein